MNIMEKINDLAGRTDNAYLEAAGSEGRRIMGCFCSYVPVEVVHAAGFVPYRMRAVESGCTEKGDLYFAPLNCTFARHCLDKVLKGDFAFLNGVVFMNGCDHSKRIYDNWRYSKTGPDFLYMHFVPHVVGSNAPGEYRAAIKKLIQALEAGFNISITDEKLRQSIALFNEMRRLIRHLDDKRKSRAVPIAGSEMLALMMAVTAIPVEAAITMLEEVIAHVEERTPASADAIRILFLAGCTEEPEHLELYEEAGGVIVSDSICFGSRFYNVVIDEAAPPLEALADGYLKLAPSCPRMMDDFPARLEVIAAMAEEYAADAVVVEKLKFCDMWGWEIERLRRESQKGRLPALLAVERELYSGATGQVKTRIQAFFEQIRNRQTVDDTIERAGRADYYVQK